MPPHGVLLVEDEPRARAHLAAAVRSHPALRLLAEADTLEAGLLALKVHRPRVVLCDLGLPDGSGLDLIRVASVQAPPPDVMVISTFGDEKTVLSAIEAGAGGYLLKDGTGEGIADGILRLLAGEAPISPAIAVHLIRRLRPAAPEGKAEEAAALLTDRELEVLQLVAKGLSYEEIATTLGLRYNTVASYTKAIYRKLAVRSRGEAVFEARQLGLLE
jgi:DNA-binding NarL/FixJ family response regulator